MGFLDNLKTRRIDDGWFWRIFHPAQEQTKKSNPVKRKVKVVVRASNQKFDRDKVQKWASDHGKTIYRPGEQSATEQPVVEQSTIQQYVPTFQGSNYFPLSMKDIINGYRLHIDGSVTDPSGKTTYAKQGTKLIPRFQGGGYTVKKGDTLSKIAKSHNMSLNQLLSLNKDIKNLDRINIGQKIKISAGSSDVPTNKPYSPYRSGIARMNESNSTARDWGNSVRQQARERGQQADKQAKKKITVTSNRSKKSDVAGTIAKQSTQSGIEGVVTKEPLTQRVVTTSSSYVPSQIYNFLFNRGVPQEQIRTLKLPDNPIDRNGNLTPECAAYINGVLKRNGINSWGNSYQINNQFKDFVNGYNNINKPDVLNENTITNFHRQAADSLLSKLDTLTMDPNKIYTANMYYTDSKGRPSRHTVDYYKRAIENNDRQYATHVGLIYHDKDRNQWRVTHNIGHNDEGHIYDEPLYEDLGGRARHGYGVTSIADAGNLKHWWEIF